MLGEKTIKFTMLLLSTNNKKLFYLHLTIICCQSSSGSKVSVVTLSLSIFSTLQIKLRLEIGILLFRFSLDKVDFIRSGLTCACLKSSVNQSTVMKLQYQLLGKVMYQDMLSKFICAESTSTGFKYDLEKQTGSD